MFYFIYSFIVYLFFFLFLFVCFICFISIYGALLFVFFVANLSSFLLNCKLKKKETGWSVGGPVGVIKEVEVLSTVFRLQHMQLICSRNCKIIKMTHKRKKKGCRNQCRSAFLLATRCWLQPNSHRNKEKRRNYNFFLKIQILPISNVIQLFKRRTSTDI